MANMPTNLVIRTGSSPIFRKLAELWYIPNYKQWHEIVYFDTSLLTYKKCQQLFFFCKIIQHILSRYKTKNYKSGQFCHTIIVECRIYLGTCLTSLVNTGKCIIVPKEHKQNHTYTIDLCNVHFLYFLFSASTVYIFIE